MKFFVDTANLDAIREIQSLGILDGVTTNPSLMAKEGIKGQDAVMQRYQDICDLVDGDVSAEVIATDFETIVKEGEALSRLHENIVVKVPMIREGLRALRYFSENDIRTNCTLIFSPAQAILAAKAGADYISPFIGRLDDINEEGISLIEQLVEIFTTQQYDTEILAASIRSSLHIVQCAQAGADVVTCPPKPILDMLNHPLTDAGLEKFLNDYKQVQG